MRNPFEKRETPQSALSGITEMGPYLLSVDFVQNFAKIYLLLLPDAEEGHHEEEIDYLVYTLSLQDQLLTISRNLGEYINHQKEGYKAQVHPKEKGS